jgi:uncharacterized protein YndB with AHSA1/START domain
MSKSPPTKAPRILEFTLDLPTDPNTAWRLLSDPTALASWFAPTVEGSGQPGTAMTLGWGPDIRWRTVVAAADPGRLVRWEDELAAYGALPPTDGKVIVEWQLSPGPEGTRLRLVHSGFGDGADWDDMLDGTRAGWTFYLWHLLETVRHHLGHTRTVVYERRSSTLSREALGARLFGSTGLALEPNPPRAGSTARLQLGGAAWTFQVEHARLPTHLFGKLAELGGALLLVEMEPGRTGPLQTGLWLSTWGLDAGALDRLRSGVKTMADAVFGPPAG